MTMLIIAKLFDLIHQLFSLNNNKNLGIKISFKGVPQGSHLNPKIFLFYFNMAMFHYYIKLAKCKYMVVKLILFLNFICSCLHLNEKLL